MIHAKFSVNQIKWFRRRSKIIFWQLKMTDGLQHFVQILSIKRVPHDKESNFFHPSVSISFHRFECLNPNFTELHTYGHKMTFSVPILSSMKTLAIYAFWNSEIIMFSTRGNHMIRNLWITNKCTEQVHLWCADNIVLYN